MKKVVILGASPGSLVNFRGDFIRSLVMASYQVVAMSANSNEKVTEAIENLGAKHQAFPVQRSGLNPFKDIASFWHLRRFFSEFDPDVVMAYTIKPVIWGGLAVAGKPQIRFYALITGLGYSFQGGSWVRRLLTRIVTKMYRASLKRAAGVIFQNRENRDEFVARGVVRPELCHIVAGSGVNLDQFSRCSLPKKGTVFLLIARLLAAKGLREFVEAARNVQERYPDARFQLLGRADPSPDAISMSDVQRWQAEGWVEYLGETDDVWPYLCDCNVFVLPSYYAEGLPRTLLEALAVGRPIITTNSPGCKETVIPGENGFLVPPRDARALADQMTWFIENRPLMADMAARSRKLAEEKFDVFKVNKELTEIMQVDYPAG